MKNIAAIILSTVLVITVLAEDPTAFTPAKKEELRMLLHSNFAQSSFPKEKEEELYQMLEAFAKDRKQDEFARSVKFNPDTTASLSFSNHGMHGGGVVIFKMMDGNWTIDEKYYFM